MRPILSLLTAPLLLLAGCRIPSYNVSPLVTPPGQWQATAGATTPVPFFLMAGGLEVRRGLRDGVDIGVQAGYEYLEDEMWKGIGPEEPEEGFDGSRFAEGPYIHLGADVKRVLRAHGRTQVTAQGGFGLHLPDFSLTGSPGFSLHAGLLGGGRIFSWGMRAHAGMQKAPFLQTEAPLMARIRLFRTPIWLHLGAVPSYFYTDGSDNMLSIWQQIGLEWTVGSPAGPRVLGGY